MDDGIVPYRRMVADKGEGAHIDPFAEFGGQEPARPQATVAAGFLFLVRDIFEEFGDRRIGVVHPDHRGRNRLLRLERLVYQKDGCLASIDVLLVFGVGEKTKGSGFSVLDLGKLRGGGFFVPVHGTAKDLGQLFGGKFHNNFFCCAHKGTQLFFYSIIFLTFAPVNEIEDGRSPIFFIWILRPDGLRMRIR